MAEEWDGEGLTPEEAAEDARLRALSDRIEQQRWGKYVHTSTVDTKPPVSPFVHITHEMDKVVNKTFDPGIYAGSDALQKLINGWQRGRLYILAGRPGMGKSTAATSWPLRTAMKGFKVALYSLEMNHDELQARCLSDLSYTSTVAIPYNKILSGETNDFQKNQLRTAWERLRDLPLQINTQMGVSLAQLKDQVADFKDSIDLLIIDHIGHLKASDRYKGNKVAETGEISAGLKQIAKEHDIAILALSQLNRAVESRNEQRPFLSDLRDSGNVEQDADVVMLMYRAAYYLERDNKEVGETRNQLELIVAKNRSGPTSTINYFVDIGCAHIADKARGTGTGDASTLDVGQAKASWPSRRGY
jgi:replicative DNA helicase